jgi:hypothetical protein
VLAKDKLGTEYLINKGAIVSIQNIEGIRLLDFFFVHNLGINPAHLAARENFEYGCELMVIRDKGRSFFQKCKVCCSTLDVFVYLIERKTSLRLCC